MEPAKIQGDKLVETTQPSEFKAKLDMGYQPVSVDQEKKHGDPLLDAASFSEPQSEVIHTGKLARELPEYHQGEARLRPAAVKAEPAVTEVIATQATVIAENAKELAEESKEYVQAKASGLMGTALDKAYQGEQYLIEKAVDTELYLAEKSKEVYHKGEDYLVHTIAPALGHALGSAYVALASATGLVMEKGKEEIEYLEEEAEQLKEKALVYGSEMAKEAKELKDEALVYGSELAKEAAIKTQSGIEVAKESLVNASEVAKESLVSASEVAKESLVTASEIGKESLLVAADKTNQAMEYLEKEAVHLSQEGVEFVQHQKEYVSEQMEQIAEDAKHNVEASTLLRELADETEIKPKPIDQATILKKQQQEEFHQSLMRHDLVAKQAAHKAAFLEHEKVFEQDISAHLTESLRLSHVEAEERLMEEGGYQQLDSPAPIIKPADSPVVIIASKDELKPLLSHATTSEPASPMTF